MAKKRYVYRPGARVAGVKPEVVHRSLEALRRRGQLTASAVVEAARAPDHPLHPAFEWDDTEAAHQYRLIQARTIIRVVQVIEDEQPPRTVYVHVPADQQAEGDYRLIDNLVETPDAYVLALGQANRRLASAREAVGELVVAARQGAKDDETIARLALAAQALNTAELAIRRLN